MEYSAIDNGAVENHLVQWEGHGPCLVCSPALRPYARMKDKGSAAFGGESGGSQCTVERIAIAVR